MEAEVSEISPGLYVGGLSSLKYLGALGITHVLSVLNFPLRKELAALHLQLPLQDSPGANMLQYLPAAIKFLDGALGPAAPPAAPPAGAAGAAGAAAGGGGAPTRAQPTGDGDRPSPATADEASGPGGGPSRVLVHCQAGVSRSPAVVAAWLMRSRGLSSDEALALIVARRPCVDPNEGFRAQLVLFGDMRCSLDPGHPVYRMWCLEELASRWEEQGYVDPVAFGQLPDGPAGLSEAVAAQQTLYRCRKCRQLLATSAHVMPVEAALGHRVFRDRQNLRREQAAFAAAGGGGADGGGPDAAESCLFVEPMQWMVGTITGVVAGKLHCPKCSARLGSFNWSGISNPSGAWVTPAFQLHLSKLDTLLPKPLEALANVRRPLLGPARAAVVPGAAAAAGGAVTAEAAATAPAAAAAAGAAEPPSLPTTLPAAVRRLGLGRAGAEEEDEEQLPEPQLQLDPDSPPAAASSAALPHHGTADGSTGPRRPQDPCTADTGLCTTESGQCTAGVYVADERSQDRDATGPGADETRPMARRGMGCGGGDGDGGGRCRTACRTAWFTHLILDCDGVLVDSEAASCEALRRAILEVTGFDIPHTFPRDYIEVFGMDVRSCVAHYRERFDTEGQWEAPELLAPRVQAAKEVHYKQLTAGGIPAFDGAERLIQRALDAGMQVGVASSGAPEKIAHNLRSSGLAPLIPTEAIVSASHVAAGKPAPDVYLAAMKATGCQDPRRALVVEDAVNGLKAARAAGMVTVGITNQLPAALLRPWSDLVVAHLDEVDPAGFVPEASSVVSRRPSVPPDAETALGGGPQ